VSSRRVVVAAVSSFAAAVVTSCATTQFDRYLSQQRWADAAAALTADSSLLNNEHELYRAGVLFGTPARPTYDPARAHALFAALIARFPQSPYRDDATARLNLIDAVTHANADAAAKTRDVESKIAELTAESHALSLRLDSAMTQRDSLRGAVVKLEADRRDRDDQIRALRLELQRLKEIDLKPRPPIKPQAPPS
jgi:hypothetical protein